jgi:hypothetical protein
MHTRPAWGLLFFGALIVGVLVAAPLWIDQITPYAEPDEDKAPFPAAFYDFSNDTQDVYMQMYRADRQQAIDYVAARLITPTPMEEPNLLMSDPSLQVLLQGNFTTLNAVRGASGIAQIIRLSDGRRVLRLENLSAINGPELHVLLSAYPNPTTQEHLDQVPQLQIDLGVLKSSAGNQNYFIEEPTFNYENYLTGSIVIYSAVYQEIFSYATLSEVTTPQ